MSLRVDQHVFLIKSIDLFISLFQLKHYVGFFFSSFDLLMWFNVPFIESYIIELDIDMYKQNI